MTDSESDIKSNRFKAKGARDKFFNRTVPAILRYSSVSHGFGTAGRQVSLEIT
jgi:hypothetical protein